MELRHLRYFATVAEEGHITRAAERLGIQQPPLSKQIRMLEDEIGARLFRRTPRGVVLTDVGTVFLEDVQKVLGDTERAVTRARRTARGEAGRIIVGLTGSATFYPLIQRIIREFRQAVPGVSLELREKASAEQVEALISEDLDVGFVRTAVPKDAGIAVYPLIEEPMLAALPEGHRLGQPMDAPLPLSALRGEPFVLYRRSTGAGLYDSIIAACNAVGFAPKIEQEAPWIGATLNLVAAGLGVTIVPASFDRMQLEGVVYRRIEDHPNLKARIDLACRRAGHSAATEAFISLVRAQARNFTGAGLLSPVLRWPGHVEDRQRRCLGGGYEHAPYRRSETHHDIVLDPPHVEPPHSIRRRQPTWPRMLGSLALFLLGYRCAYSRDRAWISGKNAHSRR